MAARSEDIGPLILLIIAVGYLVGGFVATFVIWCCGCDPEAGQGHSMANAGGRRPAPAAVRVSEPQQQLVYFSYPDTEGSGKTTVGASVVVCPICLEALVGGAECSEVPACRHVFHRGCLALWIKSNSNFPLCRRPVVPGSEPLWAAEAMV